MAKKYCRVWLCFPLLFLIVANQLKVFMSTEHDLNKKNLKTFFLINSVLSMRITQLNLRYSYNSKFTMLKKGFKVDVIFSYHLQAFLIFIPKVLHLFQFKNPKTFLFFQLALFHFLQQSAFQHLSVHYATKYF